MGVRRCRLLSHNSVGKYLQNILKSASSATTLFGKTSCMQQLSRARQTEIIELDADFLSINFCGSLESHYHCLCALTKCS